MLIKERTTLKEIVEYLNDLYNLDIFSIVKYPFPSRYHLSRLRESLGEKYDESNDSNDRLKISLQYVLVNFIERFKYKLDERYWMGEIPKIACPPLITSDLWDRYDAEFAGILTEYFDRIYNLIKEEERLTNAVTGVY